jgi:4-pyridoxolactonase
VLIEHTDGLFLFDSGYDLETVNEFLAFEQPEQTEEQTVEAQLELCGFAPGDVSAVINSHLHFDHCGGQRHLADAPTWVHREELRHALVPEPFERLGYADKVFHRPDSDYRWLEGDEVDFADGIRLLHTPGHTIGHYSLLLERDEGAPMLFPADVTYTEETWDKDLISGFHHDPTANHASLRKLKHLARRREADVFFTHDMAAWESYKHAPDHY